MKIVVDEKKLRRNAQIARTIVIGVVVVAIGMMVAALFASTQPVFTQISPNFFLVAQIAVIALLFTVSRIGFLYANRYLAFNRPEKVFRDSLKGLDRKYALMLFEKPVDYYVIEPGGVTALIPKSQETPVSLKNGKWKHQRSILRAWLGREETLGDPGAEANEAIADIQKMIAAKAPDLKVPVRAVIVFTNPKVQLDIEPSPFTVLRPEELKNWERGAGKLNELPKSIQRKMREALGAPEIPAAESDK
jgi:hypothetical protein